jgi:hypothetical protein
MIREGRPRPSPEGNLARAVNLRCSSPVRRTLWSCHEDAIHNPSRHDLTLP